MKELVTEKEFREIIEKVNQKWNQRYPNYSLALDRMYELTKMVDGTIVTLGSVSEEDLEGKQRSRIHCINGMSYTLSVLNRKDGLKYRVCTLSAKSSVNRYRKQNINKNFLSRALADLARMLGQDTSPNRTIWIGIEDAYQVNVKLASTQYVLTFSDGRKLMYSALEELADRSFEKNPIVAIKKSRQYEHTLMPTFGETWGRRLA